ncbi:hypothetical protein K438DRAFT_1957593 [Mycena galopus ATCC 62051]|nr:hypothetical protein K438DRAFT_1957593 [Mycena galopus ATCC 62051]
MNGNVTLRSFEYIVVLLRVVLTSGHQWSLTCYDGFSYPRSWCTILLSTISKRFGTDTA